MLRNSVRRGGFAAGLGFLVVPSSKLAEQRQDQLDNNDFASRRAGVLGISRREKRACLVLAWSSVGALGKRSPAELSFSHSHHNKRFRRTLTTHLPLNFHLVI